MTVAPWPPRAEGAALSTVYNRAYEHAACELGLSPQESHEAACEAVRRCVAPTQEKASATGGATVGSPSHVALWKEIHAYASATNARDRMAQERAVVEVERALEVLCAESSAEARRNLAEASKLWDGPETTDWIEGVRKEAAHQVARWGVAHDEGKEPDAWFWLLGRLAGKALDAAVWGDFEKAMHHTISSGAVLLNWHARLAGTASQFRPGTTAEGQSQ